MFTQSDLTKLKAKLIGFVPHLEPFLFVIPINVITEVEWEATTPGLTPTARVTRHAMEFVDTFIDKLDEPQRLGLLLHEILHLARGDLTQPWVDPRLTRQSFHMLANIAQDHVIEGWIAQIGRTASANATADPKTWFIRPNYPESKYKKYIDWAWRDVYEDLYDKADKAGGIGKFGDGVDAPGEAPDDGELQTLIDRAAEESERIRQTLAGTKHEHMGDIKLKAAKAVVPWQQVLRQCLTQVPAKVKRTWATINRRVFGSTGEYATGRNGHEPGIGEVTLYVDTSGSMHTTLDRVGADIMRLLADFRPRVLNLIYYDTAILRRITVAGSKLRGFKVEAMPGGGGTCVAGAMIEQTSDRKHRPHPVIVLTDGYDDYNLPYNLRRAFTEIVWLSYGTPVHSSVGRSIVIPNA
jgi:predicted metal-dependent peptidase